MSSAAYEIFKMENSKNNKPIDNNVIINTTLVFYEEEQKEHTFGSNHTIYEIYYDTKSGIMSVAEVGAFGDRTLIGEFNDKRNRKITLEEMLKNIQEMSNMTYKDFMNVIMEVKK